MFKSPVLVATDMFIPGASALNAHTARPRHWAASAFLSVLGTVRFLAFLCLHVVQLCGRVPSQPLLPLYSFQAPVLDELDL
ncbi:hypothetical protein A0H81_14011 [Grifola frondosa]|uniref:Uncharacterized protein n=1 Tax=Grifola frondosa TaxID=5627 RepID=A0A1C7LPT3_GRIFR|nr:hypothetical protein A0H81_14011 [Grifola frondosa]